MKQKRSVVLCHTGSCCTTVERQKDRIVFFDKEKPENGKYAMPLKEFILHIRLAKEGSYDDLLKK